MTLRENRRDDTVLEWILDAPKRRNAVAPADLAAIAHRCARLEGEIVVLRGARPGPFCAGFDLRHLGPGGPTPPDLPLIEATAAMERADATFVAAVAGYAIGAGVELAAACDLLVAESDAYFAVPAGRLGVVYHRAGLARIRARFGARATRAMVLCGRKVSAEDLDQGVDIRTAPGDLDAAVARLLADLRAGAAPVRRAHTRALRSLAQGGRGPAPAAWTALRRRRFDAAT